MYFSAPLTAIVNQKLESCRNLLTTKSGQIDNETMLNQSKSKEEKMRVLIVTNNMLFRDVLEILLNRQFAVSLFQATNAALEGLVDKLSRVRPHVVVVEAELEAMDDLKKSLSRNCPRVIYVHHSKNEARVNEDPPVSLTQTADFLALMSGNPTVS
jgi:hypothetical protein